jgi:hypothetical protein
MAATIVARDLNFMAYSNRAMAANHAVIGQIVSLASLSEMLYLAADDISKIKYLQGVPYIGWIFKTIGEIFEEVATVIKDYILPGLETFASIQNGLINAISLMQQGAHLATTADMLKIDEVIKANDPELRWATSGASGVFTTATNIGSMKDTFMGDFSERRSDDTAKGRMREVVNLSRDQFTIEREWFKTPKVPPGKFDVDNFFHGGTQLSSDNKTWVGVDGFEFEYKIKFLGKTIFKFGVSWWETGEVAGSSGASDWRKLSHGELSSSAHRKAYNNRKKKLQNTYDGILPYQELKKIKPGDRSEDSPTFVVLVYKPVQSSNTSNDTRTPNATQTFQTDDADNPFHLKERRTKIYGVAASQVYFRRPTRAEKDPTAGDPGTGNVNNALFNGWYKDGTYASLFSPYWQARLTDVPPLIKAALSGLGND